MAQQDRTRGIGSQLNIPFLNYLVEHNEDGSHRTVKPVWVPANDAAYYSGPTQVAVGNHPALRSALGTDMLRFELAVPSDFHELVKLVGVYICNGGWANSGGLRICADYAKVGEAYNTHTLCIGPGGVDVGAQTANFIVEVDLSSLVGNLAAGDYLGLSGFRPAATVRTRDWMGILMEYK